MDDIESKKLQTFQQLKDSCLRKDDLSLKGRTTLIEKPYGQPGLKKGSNFLFSSHELIDKSAFDTVIRGFIENQNEVEENCLWLKFEPFIMHVQCYDLYKAQVLLNIALEKGCRNSGITLGKHEKFMVAVRSTSFMEIPIHCKSRFNLTSEYLNFLREECDRRLIENKTRLLSLQEAVETKM